MSSKRTPIRIDEPELRTLLKGEILRVEVQDKTTLEVSQVEIYMADIGYTRIAQLLMEAVEKQGQQS